MRFSKLLVDKTLAVAPIVLTTETEGEAKFLFRLNAFQNRTILQNVKLIFKKYSKGFSGYAWTIISMFID